MILWSYLVDYSVFSHVVMSHFRKVESADPVMTKTEKDKVK